MSTFRPLGYIRQALSALAFLTGLALLVLILALQSRPSVPAAIAVDSIGINTIEDIIVDNAPARMGRAGELSLHLDQDELNLLSAFMFQNIPRLSKVTADVNIVPGEALLDLTIPVPTPLLPLYLNLHAELQSVEGSAEFGTLWIGNLPMPGPVVRGILALGQQGLASSYVNYTALAELKDSIRDIAFEQNAVQLTLNWEPQMIARVQNQAEQLLLSAEDSARIQHYSEAIAQIVGTVPQQTRNLSLSDLLTPLFQQARQSVIEGADPVVENRSLLQALSLYVNETDAIETTPVRRLNVTIQRRPDLAQHFTSSAAMTASVGAHIAGLLSTSKEAHDARYRSGFSFSDLTANMAGVALGNAATISVQSARQLQARLAEPTQETDYMPQVSRDNAGLSEDDFLEQYQDRTSPAYLNRLAVIDQQVAELPIYKVR